MALGNRVLDPRGLESPSPIFNSVSSFFHQNCVSTSFDPYLLHWPQQATYNVYQFLKYLENLNWKFSFRQTFDQVKRVQTSLRIFMWYIHSLWPTNPSIYIQYCMAIQYNSTKPLKRVEFYGLTQKNFSNILYNYSANNVYCNIIYLYVYNSIYILNV